VIQKSFALFQIMSIGTMDLASLLCIIGALEEPLLFLISGMFPVVPVTSTVLLISSVSGVDLPVLLLS
jgi:hypothetical protein